MEANQFEKRPNLFIWPRKPGNAGPWPSLAQRLNVTLQEFAADMEIPERLLDNISSCNKVENRLVLSEYEQNLGKVRRDMIFLYSRFSFIQDFPFFQIFFSTRLLLFTISAFFKILFSSRFCFLQDFALFKSSLYLRFSFLLNSFKIFFS